MSYGDTLNRAFRLFWRHKSLWLLGMLTAFLGRSEYNGSANVNQSFSNDPNALRNSPLLEQISDPSQILGLITTVVVALAIISAIFGIISLIFGSWANASMVAFVDAADREQPISIRASFAATRQRLMTLIGIDLFRAVPALVLIVITFAVVIAVVAPLLQERGGDVDTILPQIIGILVCGIPLILIGILVSLVFHVWTTIAVRVSVLEQQPFRPSLGLAWRIIRKNLGYTAVTWLLNAAIGVGFGFIVAIPAALMLFGIGTQIFDQGINSTVIGMFIGVVLIISILNILLGGILTSLSSTLWTIVFKAFREQETPVAPANPFIASYNNQP